MSDEIKVGDLVHEPYAGLGTIISIDKTKYYPYVVEWAIGGGVAVYEGYDIQMLKQNLEHMLMFESLKKSR